MKRERLEVEQEVEHGTPVEEVLAFDARYQQLLERERATSVRTWRNLLHAARSARWL